MNTTAPTLTLHKSTPAPASSSAVPTSLEYPGHREGLRANDLVTLHSLMVCNRLRGHLPTYCGEPGHPVWPADHRACQHS